MDSAPLMVYAQNQEAPPLRLLLEALTAAGHPARFGVGAIGEATEEELDQTDWEAAIVRWLEPELHEVALLERLMVGEDEEADLALATGAYALEGLPMSGGRYLVQEHLRVTPVVYTLETLNPMIVDDDHPAWEALDVILRALAERTDGLIYAEAAGFYDPEGEPMIEEFEDEEAEDGPPQIA